MPRQTETFIRIGSDYYKRIMNQDSAGWPYEDVRPWTRLAIIDDLGKDYLKKIKKFDAVTNVPLNNGDASEVLPNLYNLYKPIEHKPEPGQWKWTDILIRHIFGEQYELGLDYVQLLYHNPLQILPILCLVSKENATGKTTFLNWLRMLFNSNMIIVGNQDIHGRFNSHYAHKLIIAVDESRIDKDASLEKLKALATQKTINYEGKFRDAYTIPFFGKFILCSNYEDNFISAKEDDIRFWIRKVPPPEHINVNIEDDLENEVPAFLNYLKNRQLSTVKQSRMWFNADLLQTEALKVIRYQSRSWLYKELDELVTDYFLKNEFLKEFKADATDIKSKWFSNNSTVQIAYIRRILRSDFCFNSDLCRYYPFDSPEYQQRIGRAFTFLRDDFVKENLPTETESKTKVSEIETVRKNIPF